VTLKVRGVKEGKKSDLVGGRNEKGNEICHRDQRQRQGCGEKRKTGNENETIRAVGGKWKAKGGRRSAVRLTKKLGVEGKYSAAPTSISLKVRREGSMRLDRRRVGCLIGNTRKEDIG